MEGGDRLTTPEAAAHLGTVPRTRYRIIEGGEIRDYGMGCAIRRRQGDLDAFLGAPRVRRGDFSRLSPTPGSGGPTVRRGG